MRQKNCNRSSPVPHPNFLRPESYISAATARHASCMLRFKLSSGIKSSQLKNAAGHICESLKEFHSFLREVRQIEQEENNLKIVNTTLH